VSLRVEPSHEEDRFWVASRDGVFDSASWQAARREIDSIARMVGLARGSTVLAIPCGPGRHLLHLAARGYHVTGVDGASDHLEEAARRLAKAGLRADLVHADMRDFVREQAFDLALNLYTSFGYFEDEAEDARYLGNVLSSLQPGGRFVLESLTRETVNCGAATERPGDGGARLTEWTKLIEDGTAIERHFVVHREGERLEFIAAHRLYGTYELLRLLEDIGFRRVAVFGDLDGRPLTAASEFAVFVATR
jgi:cyclopropane fatty-acyl-phospholipid synthase-like methyltransferase